MQTFPSSCSDRLPCSSWVFVPSPNVLSASSRSRSTENRASTESKSLVIPGVSRWSQIVELSAGPGTNIATIGFDSASGPFTPTEGIALGTNAYCCAIWSSEERANRAIAWISSRIAGMCTSTIVVCHSVAEEDVALDKFGADRASQCVTSVLSAERENEIGTARRHHIHESDLKALARTRVTAPPGWPRVLIRPANGLKEEPSEGQVLIGLTDSLRTHLVRYYSAGSQLLSRQICVLRYDVAGNIVCGTFVRHPNGWRDRVCGMVRVS
jgi:hypothetical protein